MIVMSDGLKALAGNTIRNTLMRFTRSPLSGAMSGATCNYTVTSSSATTVAAVGFVGLDYVHNPTWIYSLLYNYADADHLDMSDTIYEGIDMLDTVQQTDTYYTGHLTKG